MNRLTISMIVLLVGIVGAYLFLKKDKHAETEELKELMRFAIDDSDDVYRIYMASRYRDPMTLTRRGDRWYLDSGHEASPFTMEVFLPRLEQFRVKYVPTDAEIDNSLPGLSAKGIKVELYDKHDDLMISYYVGGVIKGEDGAYFYKEGSDKPYVVHLPYGTINVRHLFNLTPDLWKNRTIFRNQIEDIESVHVRYPRAAHQGFDIVREGSDFALLPTDARRLDTRQSYDEDKLEKYLLGFKGMSYGVIHNEVKQRDSVLAMEPFMDMRLVTREQDTLSVILWPRSKPLNTPYEAYTEMNSGDDYLALNHMDDFGSIPQSQAKKFFVGYADLLKDL